jgi:hypothetical protein
VKKQMLIVAYVPTASLKKKKENQSFKEIMALLNIADLNSEIEINNKISQTILSLCSSF